MFHNKAGNSCEPYRGGCLQDYGAFYRSALAAVAADQCLRDALDPTEA
jgi:hypothetical protein